MQARLALFCCLLAAVFLGTTTAESFTVPVSTTADVVTTDTTNRTKYRDNSGFIPPGRHYTLDFFELPKSSVDLIKDWTRFNSEIVSFIKSSGMTLLNVSPFHFDCGGVTAVWLLSECHMSVHTWPEHAFAAFDVYTCGKGKTEQIVDGLNKLLKPTLLKKNLISRGERFPPSIVSTPPLVDMCVNGKDDSEANWNVIKNAMLLDRQTSGFFDIKIVESPRLGRCMLLNDKLQSCSADAKDYAKQLITRAAFPFKRSGKPFKVLILGGGDGWTASYLLENYENVEQISLVTKDDQVAEMAGKYFSKFFGTKNALTDTKVTKFYEDPARWLRTPKAREETYDVVIIDYQSTSQSKSKDYYYNVYKVLKTNGRLVQQVFGSDSAQEKVDNAWQDAGFVNKVQWETEIASRGEVLFWLAEK